MEIEFLKQKIWILTENKFHYHNYIGVIKRYKYPFLIIELLYTTKPSVIMSYSLHKQGITKLYKLQSMEFDNFRHEIHRLCFDCKETRKRILDLCNAKNLQKADIKNMSHPVADLSTVLPEINFEPIED